MRTKTKLRLEPGFHPHAAAHFGATQKTGSFAILAPWLTAAAAVLLMTPAAKSQSSIAYTGLQGPVTLVQSNSPGPGALERPGQTPGTYIHNPQSASSPIFVAAATDKGVPFKGSFEAVATITPINPQFLSELTKGTGNATHLGQFTVIKAEIVNLLTFTSIGSFAFTAANGDTLTADSTTQATIATPGVLSIVDTAFISGGTGRFAGATGSFIVTRSFDLATNLTAGSFEGTISSPGDKHASPSAALLLPDVFSHPQIVRARYQ